MIDKIPSVHGWFIHKWNPIQTSCVKMNFRLSENYEEEILRLNKRVKALLTYSEKGNYLLRLIPHVWWTLPLKTAS